ncbi:MAG: hypothetical protein E7195_02775 [Peptococcaceae bacterium]|nr:hypothetical protein [Peptococcaceae bacterium]
MTYTIDKNKIIAIILCFTMLFSITSGIFSEAFAAEENIDTHMVYDVTDGKDITLGHAQKATLTARGGEQWQIYIYDADMWVDIAGKTGSSMELSYPLVASALTDRGTGELRCELEDGSYSGIVNLVIDFSAESSFVKEIEEEEVVVLEEATEIVDETEDESAAEEQDEVTSEDADEQPADGTTEETENQTPADGTTEENGNQTPVDGATDENGNQTPNGDVADENQTPADTDTTDSQAPADNANTGDAAQQPADTATNTNTTQQTTNNAELEAAVKNDVAANTVTNTTEQNTTTAVSTQTAPATETLLVKTETPLMTTAGVFQTIQQVQNNPATQQTVTEPVIQKVESAPVTKVETAPVVSETKTVTESKTDTAVSSNNDETDNTGGSEDQPVKFTLTKNSSDNTGSDTDMFGEENTASSTTDDNYGVMLMAEEDEGELVTYNVVINYVFENTEIVADPYTANLAAGSNFSTTVTFPIVQGYLPYLNDVQQNLLELNISKISENKTYNVVYKPTNVNYTVIHYQQNLEDDNYTEVERETLQGLTKTIVQEVAKAYDGFYALAYEKPTIAADGSTLVEIYYDRYYYLMKFELSGGYGVEPIYAKYGSPVSVGNPTRLGYTFAGWNTEIPATVPVNGGTYTAQWTPDNATKYTVVYWGENANDSNYSYLGYAEKTAVSGTTVSGADDYNGNKTGFHFDHADQDVTVKGDGSTIVNVYYKRNTYTLTFAYEGGPLICDTHVHSTGCYELTCTKEEHEHKYTSGDWGYYYGGCYPANGGYRPICGIEEHEHETANYWNDYTSCYGDTPICGQTGVNNHTHSVSNGCYGMKFENVKYGADTSSLWSQAPSYRWKTTSDGNTAYTYAPAMPNSDLTVYGQTLSNSYQYTIHYYEEGTTTKVHADNVYYRSSDGYYLTTEDYIAIPGFTCLASGSTYPDDNLVYKIYYRRNSYTLTFKNGSAETDGGRHLYEADISSKYFEPTYTGDEPEAYTFGGWYTTEACIEGTQFNFTGAKMPYNNLILYAKWVPVSHTVDFYLDRAALEAGTKIGTETVAHGTKINPVPDTPQNGAYNFIGWFYMEGDVEKAFDFANMPVNKNLQVYGKWSSTVLMPYVIYYKYQDTQESIAVPVALELEGSALAGTTKTFEAKGGTDLYESYREGYFPVVKSHSITIVIEENDAGVEEWYVVDAETGEKKQGFTFWYVQKDAVPYTVEYLDAETGATLKPAKTVSDNRKAVVTEKFVPIAGYMPDAYQKRLVVSGEDGAVNKIIFYYTEDKDHAYYKITHYTQNTDGKTWTEYASSQAVGDIDEIYSADPLTIQGFKHDPTVSGTVTSGQLTASGLELKLYYVRNKYPYQVRYLEEGSGKPLADPKDGEGLYGQVVSESAIDIENYTAVNPTSQTLNIRIEESQTEAKLNIINFYYEEEEVTINYEVVGPAGSGTVNPASETVKVLSGTAQGSTATANEGYRFVGWYSGSECNDNQLLSTDAKYVPQKDTNNKNVAATYYAKFDYNLIDLKIEKTGAQDIDANQTFIFNVKGTDSNTIGVDLKVTVQGNGSVTIPNVPYGTYSVTEETGWSWRYNCTSITFKDTTPDGRILRTFTVVNERSETQWLDISTWIKNWFGASSATRPSN